MVILTNCLAERVDEGCLKVANSLTRRIKKKCPASTILTYERNVQESDVHLQLNKLFLNLKLFAVLRKKKEPVLYIPFSACTKASILRTAVLAAFSRVPVNVLFVSHRPLGPLFQGLLRWSKARIFSLSKESYVFFQGIVGDRAIYLKTGVDTKKFRPISPEEKAELRRKYEIPDDAKVLLHVGHLKEGRNIRALLNVDPSIHVVLVVSTLTEGQWDEQLRRELNARPNTILIDTFVENIEQIYQMADVYMFPVQEAGNCIDTPLSVLEAAACGIPALVTAYGELKELLDEDGFYPIQTFEPEPLNELVLRACSQKRNGRQSVLAYEWDRAVENLLSLNI